MINIFENIKYYIIGLFVILLFFVASQTIFANNYGQEYRNDISKTGISVESVIFSGFEIGQNKIENRAGLKSKFGQECENVGTVISNAAKQSKTIIGETMVRVEAAAAKNPGSVILNDMPKFTGSAHQVTSKMMTYNRKWILQQMRSGRPILDIGTDAARKTPSIFYQMEQNMLRNYQKLHPGSLNIIKP